MCKTRQQQYHAWHRFQTKGAMQGHQVSAIERHQATPTERVNPAAPRTMQGYSLLEIMVVLGIVAITVGAAAPAITDFQERYRLEGQSGELVTDLHYIRSEALARNQPLRISFSSDGAGGCYVLHSGEAGDCDCASDGTALCHDPDNAIIKSVGFAASRGIRLQANVISMLFDPGRGTTTPAGSVNLIGTSGNTIRQVVSITGRTRSCSPDGRVSGYKAC
jgi:type IV fimbrial biogenesis protein FimT